MTRQQGKIFKQIMDNPDKVPSIQEFVVLKAFGPNKEGSVVKLEANPAGIPLEILMRKLMNKGFFKLKEETKPEVKLPERKKRARAKSKQVED